MNVSSKKLIGKCPLWTWAMMGLVLVSALVLIDWTDTRAAKPLWMFFLPIAFGLAGGIIATVKKSYGWGLISVAFGALAVQLLAFAVTLVQGP